MEKNRKNCPGCGAVLKEAYAGATYGRVLLLDQCPRCGGVWFDRWELYFLKESEARRLDSVNLKTLDALNPAVRGGNKCPACSTKLVDFIDPTLPEDASIRRCANCSGLWLNRGELTRFAARRSALRGVNQKPRQQKTPDIEALKNIQKALDTTRLASPAVLELDSTPISPGEMAKDLAPIILQILFKLVFRI